MSKDDFRGAKGRLSGLSKLTKDLKEKELSLGKLKKALSVIASADEQKPEMVSSFFRSKLAEAKDKKKAIIKASQRLETILEENEDVDGKPLTFAMVDAFYNDLKLSMESTLDVVKTLQGELKKLQAAIETD